MLSFRCPEDLHERIRDAVYFMLENRTPKYSLESFLTDAVYAHLLTLQTQFNDGDRFDPRPPEGRVLKRGARPYDENDKKEKARKAARERKREKRRSERADKGKDENHPWRVGARVAARNRTQEK